MKVGQIVKVNPFLTTDPNNKHGEVGSVIGIDDDIVTVKFDDGTIGKYMEDALL